MNIWLSHLIGSGLVINYTYAMAHTTHNNRTAQLSTGSLIQSLARMRGISMVEAIIDRLGIDVEDAR